MALLDPVTMSQPIGKSKTGEASKSKDGETPTQAVRTIASPLAQIVKHVYPVLLLSLFVLRFDALVADPVTAMSSSLPVVVAMQIGYVVTCLPPAGSQTTKPAKKLRPGEKKKPGSDSAGPNIAVVCFYPLFLLLSSS